MMESRDHLLNLANLTVHQKMYPKAVLECEPESLKTPLNLMDMANYSMENGITSVQGSFRKLEFD